MRVLTQNRGPHLMVTNYSPIAQLVERLTVNQLVPGSSPGRGANFRNKNKNLRKPATERAFSVLEK